jgi:hypothetical protein
MIRDKTCPLNTGVSSSPTMWDLESLERLFVNTLGRNGVWQKNKLSMRGFLKT